MQPNYGHAPDWEASDAKAKSDPSVCYKCSRKATRKLATRNQLIQGSCEQHKSMFETVMRARNEARLARSNGKWQARTEKVVPKWTRSVLKPNVLVK